MDNLKTDKTKFLLPKMKLENTTKWVIDQHVYFYILYLNKDEDFKENKVMFNEHSDAVVWGKKNLDNFSLDMIKYESNYANKIKNEKTNETYI